MTGPDSSPNYDDAEILALIASIDLVNINPPSPAPPPPRTPPPTVHCRTIEHHTFPSIPGRTHVNRPLGAPQTPSRSAVPKSYIIDSPTTLTSSEDWPVPVAHSSMATAGVATQGVPNAHVRAVGGDKKKKSHSQKVAFVVFCGLDVGVFLSWDEVKPLVRGVSCSVYRGYPTLDAAEAAFQFALDNSWVCRTGDCVVAAIPHLPQPIPNISVLNVLHDTEALDNTWYVVYRGITPGVYRSHLESQLNTLGVRGALHEGIQGKAEALRKYTEAFRRGEVDVVPPRYPDDILSPPEENQMDFQRYESPDRMPDIRDLASRPSFTTASRMDELRATERPWKKSEEDKMQLGILPVR
ncbi:hypothetical protein DFH07DRAFT_775850 [Mycena maculata]|uniref:Ribonuclease H1 N-terminal domain-containing protein n=1 Tax=Mycena maculata TaxID=230809 RepID=A0AAD7N6G0_9AGAR|nr:hypothetical protein DFH07DRAFT_775850 [Mycena maculata]